MLANRSDSINSLLGEKTPHTLNQQNNFNNKSAHTGSKYSKKKTIAQTTTTPTATLITEKIVLNDAGLKAITSNNNSNTNAKWLNFQEQAQHVSSIPVDAPAVDEQYAQHEEQQQEEEEEYVAPAPELPFVLPPFGTAVIPLPPIRYDQQVLLPPIESSSAEPQITVVFDLDETLVYNRRMDLDYALLRPYALHMLNALRQLNGIEIVLWTASTRDTAAPVVEQLNSRGIVFDHLIYRNDKWFNDPYAHTKDLRLLGRDMNRVVIVDNQPNCCKLNPGNAVLVEDYLGATDEAAKDDATLVNLYYIVDFMLQNTREHGMSVQQTLESLASEHDARGRLCRFVGYGLPMGWTPYHVRTIRPLNVPAHGHFVRACTESPAPLEYWTA